MGQQQLLLLVLGVVLVGLAVIVGIQAFGETQRRFRQDQTVHLMTDIAARAQAWKATPSPLGGGDAGDSSDFSTFTLAAIGMTPTETQGSREVLMRTEYACLKIFARTNRLQVNALDADCSNGSWWMRMDVTGIGEDHITYRFNGNSGAVNDNGQ